MMAQHPYLPLWTDAYLADTIHLDCMESGAYLHLLISAWRTPDCTLPDDDKRLARFAKCSTRQWAKIKPSVMEFWVLDGNQWTQKRLLKEREYVEIKRGQQSQAGKASALKRTKTVPPTQVDRPIPVTANSNPETQARNTNSLKNNNTSSTDVSPPLQREANGEPTPTPTPTPTPIRKKNSKKNNGRVNGKGNAVIELKPETYIEAANLFEPPVSREFIEDIIGKWMNSGLASKARKKDQAFINFTRTHKERNRL